MNTTWKRWGAGCLTLVMTAALLACGGGGDDDDDAGEATPTALALSELGRYTSPQGETAAEIPAYDAASRRVFVVNGALGSLDVLDLSDPAAPALVQTLGVDAVGAGLGGINSVAVRGGIVAVAIEAADKQQPGTVAFLRASDLALLGQVQVGALPDMVVFSADGRTALVANEGEPNADYSVDPEGSISVIDASDPAAPVARTAGFAAFNGQLDALRAAGVRIYGPGATVAQDVEPEYIAVSSDGKTAWVTLQENNALAIVDVESATVQSIEPLGYKDHRVAGNGLDPSDRDAGVDIRAWPLLGMYQPDAIAAFRVGGQTYLVTANEGDAREYDTFAEETRVKDLTLDPAVFTDALCGGPCADDDRLGRLNVTAALGAGADGHTALYAFGARSFSIWDAAGTLVYDSGDDLEQRTRALPNVLFNAGNDENALDNRSDNKGPEPEGVAVARFGAKTYAFIGLERVGGVAVYDISTPAAPVFATYLNTRDGDAGDLGPEGLVVVPAADSPNGKPLLIVGHEVSGTTAVYQIDLAY
ncbi:choice-of-anchor I family protein [Schlegelella sp. S2-27]|uniref:Choice-of-anchor I family protein n=1 Tax=Caldimonas mangrovi TaxID=2944811 RepID=A0ABT0YKP3_9BURK|nr:choice-of-anchor I family protein [Caldimonas mangrovi]MCM5679275.1 choice-of-anchor I family protein [Caldimonas mangrovi]